MAFIRFSPRSALVIIDQKSELLMFTCRLNREVPWVKKRNKPVAAQVEPAQNVPVTVSYR
jgi:hypothetical protein